MRKLKCVRPGDAGYSYSFRAHDGIAWNLTDSVKDFEWIWLAADIAIFGLGIATLVGIWESRRRKRRRLQYSLRTLFIVMTLACFALGWWMHEREQDKELKTHCAKMQRLNPFSDVELVPRFPLWIRALVSDERLSDLGINQVAFCTADWDDRVYEDARFLMERYPDRIGLSVSGDSSNGLSNIGKLGSPAWLIIYENADKTLEALAKRRQPRAVRIMRPTSDGLLIGLAQLTSLETLIIDNATAVTDRDVAPLSRLLNLEVLSLDGARITDVGLDGIAALPRLKSLRFDGSLVTDAGLRKLAGLSRLEDLCLSNTAVTDEGIAALKRSLPNLNVNR